MLKRIVVLLLFVSSCSSEEKEPVFYNLSTNVVPANSGQVNASTQYNEGDVAILTASPNLGFEFDFWSGDITGGDNPAQLTMTSNKSVTANFKEKIPTRLKFGLEELWDDKRIFAFENGDSYANSNKCSGFKYSREGWSENHGTENFSGYKFHHYSVDSLITDFSNLPVDNFVIEIQGDDTTDKRKAALERIGYIKIVGDTLGKRINIDFMEAHLGSRASNFARPAIKYGDSNIDFSGLIRDFNHNNIPCGEKVSSEEFTKLFNKTSLSKEHEGAILNYSSDLAKKEVGDELSLYGYYYTITSIEKLYN